MNIITDCVVINQCDKEGYEKYKNFKIYSYTDRWTSKIRNLAIEKSTGDILLFCDADCLKKGLKLYASMETIASNTQGKSTWFNGYTERYFFEK